MKIYSAAEVEEQAIKRGIIEYSTEVQDAIASLRRQASEIEAAHEANKAAEDAAERVKQADIVQARINQLKQYIPAALHQFIAVNPAELAGEIAELAMPGVLPICIQDNLFIVARMYAHVDDDDPQVASTYFTTHRYFPLEEFARAFKCASDEYATDLDQAQADGIRLAEDCKRLDDRASDYLKAMVAGPELQAESRQAIDEAIAANVSGATDVAIYLALRSIAISLHGQTFRGW